jgi:hypothetical protein
VSAGICGKYLVNELSVPKAKSGNICVTFLPTFPDIQGAIAWIWLFTSVMPGWKT